MSRLAEFQQLEKHLTKHIEALETLKGDVSLKKETEFETKLRTLLGEYNYSLKDVINLLDPQFVRLAAAAGSKGGARKAHRLKVYKNPHAGEVVETKGGNHKVLKEWKAKHRLSTVDSLLTS